MDILYTITLATGLIGFTAPIILAAKALAQDIRTVKNWN